MRGGLTVVQDADFDPQSVPLYPMVRAEIRETDEGEYVGLVDDQIVSRNLDEEPVSTAVVAACARLAARRLGDMQAIRVRVQAPEGGAFDCVVTATEDVYDLTDPELAAAVGGAGRKGGKKRAPIATPDGLDSEGGRGRPHPLFLVIVAVPTAMILFFVWILFFANEGSEPAERGPLAAEPRQLPVVAPQGYSPVAAWAVDVDTPVGAEVHVAADDERIYTVDGAASDEIVAWDAETGVEAWRFEADHAVQAGPALTAIAGDQVIAVATSSELVTLSPETGDETGRWELDTQSASTVRMTATGPVVIGRSNTAQIVVGDELATRVMPAGATPVAPGPDGSLIAVSGQRVHMSRSATVAGEGSALQPVGEGVDEVTVVGWTGEQLLVAHGSSTSPVNEVQLAGYSVPDEADGAWRRVWLSEAVASGAAVTAGGQFPLVAGPSGEWGIYESSVVDLSTGSLTSLEEWSTVTVGDDIAFGVSGSRVLSAGVGGLGGESSVVSGATRPEAPQAVAGSAAYLVTAGTGSDTWLYALRPEPQAGGSDDRGPR